MAPRQEQLEQLTLDVGGGLKPLAASFRVGGKMLVDCELKRGEQVTVTISDADGCLIAAGAGYVNGIGFETHRPKDLPEWVERVHKIKLD